MLLLLKQQWISSGEWIIDYFVLSLFHSALDAECLMQQRINLLIYKVTYCQCSCVPFEMCSAYCTAPIICCCWCLLPSNFVNGGDARRVLAAFCRRVMADYIKEEEESTWKLTAAVPNAKLDNGFSPPFSAFAPSDNERDMKKKPQLKMGGRRHQSVTRQAEAAVILKRRNLISQLTVEGIGRVLQLRDKAVAYGPRRCQLQKLGYDKHLHSAAYRRLL